MEQKHTDKQLLMKGIKYMALTLPLLFLSPYLITLSFLNNTALLFLIPGLSTGVLGVYFGFKGLKTIAKSMFG
jgi:hypothetical protein